MPRNKCCVQFCKSGHHATRRKNNALGIKNPSMFKFPSNPELFDKWVKAVRREDKKLTARDKICQLHFDKKSIKTHDQILLSNGDVYVSKRRKLTLVKGAIPTIFPDPPHGFSGEKSKNPALADGSLENADTSVRKRRLETIFGDSRADASKSTGQEMQPTVNRNSTIKFVLDDQTDSTEDTVQTLQPDVNDNSMTDLDDTNAVGSSVEKLQSTAKEKPTTDTVSDVSCTGTADIADVSCTETEDTDQQLPTLQPNPLADDSDDSMSIEYNVLQMPDAGHNQVTVWIKEEEEDCVDEFADSTAIENFDDLFRKCSKMEFPDNRWGHMIIGNNILITYWNLSFECTKKIMIDRNLKISAFVKEVGIIIDETEVHDLNTVKNVVKKLHDIKECAYNPANNIRWKCRGFVKQNKDYCSACSYELEKNKIIKKKSD